MQRLAFKHISKLIEMALSTVSTLEKHPTLESDSYRLDALIWDDVYVPCSTPTRRLPVLFGTTGGGAAHQQLPGQRVVHGGDGKSSPIAPWPHVLCPTCTFLF